MPTLAPRLQGNMRTLRLCIYRYDRKKTTERAREHLNSARKRSTSSALGQHYADDHPTGEILVSFTVIKHCRDSLRLHIEEAMAIKEQRSKLNRRDEHQGTGFLILIPPSFLALRLSPLFLFTPFPLPIHSSSLTLLCTPDPSLPPSHTSLIISFSPPH